MGPAGPSRWRGLLALLSCFFAICTAALAVSAFLRWRTRADITSHWPVTTATVRRCAVHRDYPFRRSGGGISVWMVCDLDYEVDGRPIETRVVSASKHAGDNGASLDFRDGHFVVQHPETMLEGWSHRHPRGSAVVIRYDPVNPSSATFVGADASLDDDPLPEALAGVVMFGLFAVGSRIGAARLARST
jgi:hypothetical protein